MKKYKTRKLVKTITGYGFHLWVIFLLANVFLAYSFNLFSRASEGEPEPEFDLRQEAEIINSPTPLGATIDLAFSIPGIGSGGGNMTPKHPKRNVTVYLYAPDVSAVNIKIAPLYVIQSTVVYDSNPLSPTYTSFINPALDLGADVKNGTYQITFRTEQSFRTLIKEHPDDVGGKLIKIDKQPGQQDSLGQQVVIMGDIAPPPEGNSSMDIDDFNLLLNCYGSKEQSPECPIKKIADLNDDGVIDGIDYNIMIIGFQNLVKQGYPPVTISVPPAFPTTVTKLSDLSPTPEEKKPTPTPAPVPQASKGGALVGGIIFVLFVVIVGVIGFILYKKKFAHKSTPESGDQSDPGSAGDQSDPGSAEDQSNPGSVAAQAPAQTPAEPSVQPTAPDANAPQEYFVKKESDDPGGNGVWLTLTGDSGAISGHYTGKEIVDGFASVKGEMKTENGKTFMEISEIKPSA